MPIHHAKIIRALQEARDATVPPCEGFNEALRAIQPYREYLENEQADQRLFSFSDITDRIDSGIRSMEVLAGEGITLMFSYVRSTGRYIVNFCQKTLNVFDD